MELTPFATTSTGVRTCGYLTQNTVHAKPEAQAKESAQFSSLARFEVAHYVFSRRFRNPKRQRGRATMRVVLAYASGYEKMCNFRKRKRGNWKS